MRRIQRRRTKGWRMPEGAVYVGRPTRWGNPYRWQDYRADWSDASEPQLRRMASSDYRGLVEGRWDKLGEYPGHPTVDEIRSELRGHDLVCWCPTEQSCHADVLLMLANA